MKTTVIDFIGTKRILYLMVILSAMSISNKVKTQTAFPNPVCYGDPISLICNLPGCGVPGATYSWTNVSGSWSSSEENPVILPGNVGYASDKFFLEVSYSPPPGGFSGGRVTVVVRPPVVPILTGPATAYQNSSGNIYSTQEGQTNYTWNIVGGTITDGITTNAITVTWNLPGTQTVSVNYTNANGCTAVAPTIYNVVVYPPALGCPSACVNFDDGNSNFITYASDGTTTTDNLAVQSPGAEGYSGDMGLKYTDISGSDYLYNNSSEFKGNYLVCVNKCICWDIYMDTNDVSYYPSIFLFRGFNPTLPYGPGNPQYLARFTSNRLTGFNVWEHTCAKIQPSVGNALPVSLEGSWSWVNGNLPWNDFISNIDGIMFKGDVNEWPGQEIFILDNICMNSCDCTPPPSGMVAWWPLDETLGTVSHDISGIYNNNGTCLNGPVPGQGKVKAGLFFDGIDDYVEAPDQSELNFGTSNFSIDAWIKTTLTTGDQSQSIVDKRHWNLTNSQSWGYCFFLHEGCLSLQLADGEIWGGPSTYTDYFTSVFVADGFWHHVAVTVKRNGASGIKFYKDGVQIALPISCDRHGSLTNSNPLRIGKQSTYYPAQRFSGTLDEIEMFNRVLSPVEISSLYNAGSAGKCKPGILACDSCPNPLLSLHTGIGGATDSKWNLITAPSGVPTGAANIVYNWRQYGLNNPLEASDWVAPPWINPCPRAIPGTYTYTCQFNLPTCPSGSYPQLKICILGENATIKLNGNIVGVANSQVSVTHLSDVFFPDFVTGLNILQIELNNRSTQYPVFNAKVWICCGAQGPVAGCDSCPVILQNRHTGSGSSTDNNWSITSAPYGVATGPAYIIPYPSTYLPGPPIQQSQWISSGTPPPTVQGQYVFTCNFYNYMMQSPYYAKLYICVKGKNAEVNLNGQYIGTSCSAESFTQFVAYPSSMGPNTIKIVLVTSAGEYPVIDVKAWICREAISIIPTSGNIINTTIHTNEGFCYSVTDTLIVAGNLTTFLVENGGSATMVAGQVVSLMPGTTIQAGGYLHASITTTGQYCSSTKTSEYETPSGMETNSVQGSKPDDQSFRIYPNPTTGGFSLEFKDLEESAEFQVEIYSILGERMLSGKLQGQKRYELSLAGKPNGVYFIRVLSGKHTGTGMIIKQ